MCKDIILEITLHSLQIVGAILTIVTLILGVSVLSEIKKQRQKALSSFYAKLVTMLDMLTYYVGEKFPNNCVYYKFCPPSSQVTNKPDEITVSKVKDISSRIVNLFMESDNQVPLFSANDGDKFHNWNSKKTKLLDLLLEVQLIGTIYIFNDPNCQESSVRNKWQELHDTIESIKNIINLKSKKMFK